MMTNNQNISALIDLSKICEPLKIYQRNQDGTEYKTYSPFTLFADACTADAEDADSFNNSVSNYLKNQNNQDYGVIMEMLEKWSKNHDLFQKIDMNPKLKPLEPLSNNLSKTSELLLAAFKNKSITPNNLKILKTTSDALKLPYQDVELAIVESLEKLFNYLEQNYLTP